MARFAFFLTLALSGTAYAEPTEPDVATPPGTDLKNDPYKANSRLTTGRFEFFRHLYGEPDALAKAMKPVATPAPAPAPAAPAPAAPAPEEGKAPEGEEIKVAPPPEKPEVASTPKARGSLPVRNPTSAWVKVVISGTEIGTVDPYDTAMIHDVPAGSYDITMTNPNGFTFTDRAETVAR